MKILRFCAWLIFLITLISCDAPPPTVELPVLSGYQTLQPKDIQEWISKAPSIATGDPQLDSALGAMKFINGVSKCYQDQGAVQIGFYSGERDSLSAGIVVVVDHNRVTDIKTLAVCSIDGLTAQKYEMCFLNDTIEKLTR